MIEQMKSRYPVQALCEVLDCPRSSYYYEPQPANDEVIQDKLEQLGLLELPANALLE